MRGRVVGKDEGTLDKRAGIDKKYGNGEVQARTRQGGESGLKNSENRGSN